MTDQCTHCSCRGDIEVCRKEDCAIHETWYAQTQRDEIERLEAGLEGIIVQGQIELDHSPGAEARKLVWSLQAMANTALRGEEKT